MPSQFINRLYSLVAGGTQNLRVSMVGPSGVGKTSLVTSMCDRMQALVDKTDLVLTCRPQDSNALIATRRSLQALFSKPESLWVDPTVGVPPTADPRDFRFWLGRSARRRELMLQFCDYPGEWMSRYASTEEWNYVAELVCGSVGSLVPIDTPALMENATWHEERNLPGLVADLFRTSYVNLETPRLVALVPLRCERYMNGSAPNPQLVARVRQGYRELLNVLAERHHLVSVVIAPVQTVGQIEFVDSVDRNSYRPQFAKCSPDAVYDPCDSDQPLRYLLRFIMRLHQDQRDAGLFGLIRRVFGSDEPLIHAVREFAAGCKTTDGFEVLQGAEWLDTRRLAA